MPVENVTANREYPKPFGGNNLSFDVLRIALALEGIDSDVAALLVALAGKAGFNSPTFTGTPQAPTAVLGTNSGQLATTAFVQAAVAALVSSAPGTLDTLNEIAAALGDDENFAATIAEALSLRLRIDAAQTLTPTQRDQVWNNLGFSADVRGLLAASNNAAARTALGLGSLATDSIAPLSRGGTGQNLADVAAFRTFLGMSANGQSLVTAANYAAMRTLLGFSADGFSLASAANVTAMRALLDADLGIRQIVASGDGNANSTNGPAYGAVLGQTATLNAVGAGSNCVIIYRYQASISNGTGTPTGYTIGAFLNPSNVWSTMGYALTHQMSVGSTAPGGVLTTSNTFVWSLAASQRAPGAASWLVRLMGGTASTATTLTIGSCEWVMIEYGGT